MSFESLHVVSSRYRPWGGYGNILINGSLRKIGSGDYDYELMRCGPYVPMVTMPMRRLVVSEEAKSAMIRAGCVGPYRELPLSKLLALDWQVWDPAMTSPAVTPRSGEPEGYLDAEDLGRPLLDTASLGSMWFAGDVIDDASGANFHRRFAEGILLQWNSNCWRKCSF